MKILHLLYESHGDYFGIGGVGIRAYEIYTYLKDRHDITLLCKKYPGAKDKEIEGLRHIFVGAESKDLTKTLLSYAYQSINFVRKHEEEFDIIIEEFSPAIPTFLHVFTKKPVILQIQGHTGALYFKKYNPVYAVVLYIMEHLRPLFYDNFIFISGETVKKLLPPFRPPLARGGWGSVKRYIVDIPNGISPELLETSPDEGDYILYLGRIDIYGKGLDILLRAYQEIFRSFPHIGLKIAGDGRDMGRFKNLLYELPETVRKNIELLGWLSGFEKEKVLRSALFAVFPSRHEVQPISLLEAMAYGKPVIVSSIPAFSCVRENGSGISFGTGNPLALAEAMKEILRSDDRSVMGQRGRDWVRNFTWDKIAEQYEQFLHKVLDKSGRGFYLLKNGTLQKR